MNVALYGGSFDPPHLGHVAVVETALKQLEIDKLIIVPTFRNPFKERVAASGTLRLKWLERLFDDPRVEISPFEIEQARPVPTIETVRHYHPSEGTIYLIVGADNLPTLPKWFAFETLNTMVTWVIASRQGYLIPEGWISLHVAVDVSSTLLRDTYNIELLPPQIATEVIDFYKETHAPTH
ncbi:MAG: nicotinate (nicotinamide) nucleotide adenylyltransferase [Campylobacterales bacterium]|nr:nicotinate (nicotinamide) nucleotide adenylyltransferase [Campylobacterales bacterium]